MINSNVGLRVSLGAMIALVIVAIAENAIPVDSPATTSS